MKLADQQHVTTEGYEQLIESDNSLVGGLSWSCAQRLVVNGHL